MTCGVAAIVVALGLPPSSAPTPTTGSIEPFATLATARSVHTTTVLPSGDLLVAGGMTAGGGSLSSAELINGSTGRVRRAASMAQARASHTATALPDGRVMLAGGYDGEYLSSVEVHDPRRNQFVTMGRLNEGRSGHTATLLADGRILIAGGVGRGWSFLASAELFDPATGQSQPVGPLGVPRESHTATLLTDGRVLVVGGHRGRREAMEVYPSAELYDPATRRFQPTARMTTPPGPSMANTRYKIEGTSVRLANGDVLVPSGARGAELLDHDSFTFRPVAGEFPSAFHFATATALATGDVVIVGGYDNNTRNTPGVWRFRAR